MDAVWTTVQNMWNSVADTLRFVRLVDVIDIAIVAFLLYKAIDLIRHTSAVQLLKGIGFLLALAVVAWLVRLHMLTFILDNTLQLGLLAIVVVFQPELRKLLERVGKSRLPNIFEREAATRELGLAIKQTVDACSALSRAREGALIVFERVERLDEVIKTGTEMDAHISGDLLKNIFFPKAPLHDGAVIVREGRIAGAGCMLPLTTNSSISRELGMRHRAGIGVTEDSDAVVIIISEESGSISVAMGGILKRQLSPETLDKLLHNELMPQSEEKRSGLPGLLDNLKVKKNGRQDDKKR